MFNPDRHNPMSPECGDTQLDNEDVKAAFSDFEGPYDLYRSTYKYTPCGPTVGMSLLDPDGKRHNLYCDDLPRSWAAFDEKGWLVTKVMVSSIVEGIDACTDSYEVDILYHTPDEIRNDFYKAVEDVDAEANSLWDDSHGCPTCAKHWIEEFGDGPVHDWKGEDDDRWDIGGTPVWKDCPACGGSGTVI